MIGKSKKGGTRGRPAETWFFYRADVDQICDTPRSLEWHAKKCEVETENLLSLLVFCATHLKPLWRKRLQFDATLSALAKSTSIPDKQLVAGTAPADATTRLRWSCNSNTLMESLGCSENQIHIEKHREHLDPARLISVLRFSMWRSRPLQRAQIQAALFAVPMSSPPAVKKSGAKVEVGA